MKDCHEPSGAVANLEYSRLDPCSIVLSRMRAVATADLFRTLRLLRVGFMRERRTAAISVIEDMIPMVIKRTSNEEQMPLGGSLGLFSQNIFDTEKYVDA